MERNLVLGVDPGFKGALCFYDYVKKEVKDIYDMPTTLKENGKTQLDLVKLAWIIDLYSTDTLFAIIEDVGPRPKEGVVSVFSFGFGTGAVHGVVSAHYIPIHIVKPSIWKMLTGLSSSKNLSRERATTLFPQHTHRFIRKKDDGRAESALLAKFAADRFISHQEEKI
jgi:hypothetical protein